MSRNLLIIVLGAALVGGCASMGTNYDATAVEAIEVGTPMSAVIARLGPPNSRTVMPYGSTLLLWMHSSATAFGSGQSRSAGLQFDAQGRFVRVIQTTQTNLN